MKMQRRADTVFLIMGTYVKMCIRDRGKEARQAAAAAVYVHACAADELIQRMDAYSIQPGDLIAVLSDTYGKLKR